MDNVQLVENLYDAHTWIGAANLSDEQKTTGKKAASDIINWINSKDGVAVSEGTGEANSENLIVGMVKVVDYIRDQNVTDDKKSDMIANANSVIQSIKAITGNRKITGAGAIGGAPA